MGFLVSTCTWFHGFVFNGLTYRPWCPSAANYGVLFFFASEYSSSSRLNRDLRFTRSFHLACRVGGGVILLPAVFPTAIWWTRYAASRACAVATQTTLQLRPAIFFFSSIAQRSHTPNVTPIHPYIHITKKKRSISLQKRSIYNNVQHFIYQFMGMSELKSATRIWTMHKHKQTFVSLFFSFAIGASVASCEID